MSSIKKSTVLNKLGLGSTKRTQSNGDANSPQKWIHTARGIKEGFVMYQAKYLGSIEVQKAKGTEVVKEAIKKLKVQWHMKKSEAGHKGSKLQRVEINISIDSLKVIDAKTRQMICGRPLHRVSYCADDHSEKKLFAFIAKDQETKKHSCFVFICDRMAADLTMTLGQAFQMAYRRYCDNEKADIKRNKEMIDIGNEIEKMKTENVHLREKLDGGAQQQQQQQKHDEKTNKTGGGGDLVVLNGDSGNHLENEDTPSSMFFHSSDADSPPHTPRNDDDINSLANPFSPSMQSPRVAGGGGGENLFDASFETSLFPAADSNTPASDLFDPFGNATTTYVSKSQGGSMDFLNTLDNSPTSNNQNDFFGAGGNSTNIFNSTTATNNIFDSTPAFQTNGTLSNNASNLPYEYHDFDTFGNSPTKADFGPKVDPFADTPDWESVASVASEEISGPGATASSQNPFSIGSEQMTTNQNMDLFSTKNRTPIDPFDNTDPFANGEDPFGASNQNSDFFDSVNQTADPFGTTNQNPDLFGLPNQNSDPFGSPNQNSDIFDSANQSADPFGTTNQNPDLFGSTNTNNNIDLFNNTTPSANYNQNLFSSESSLDPFGTTPTNEMGSVPTSNPFFTNNEHRKQQSTQDSGHDIFSDYLSKVASKVVGERKAFDESSSNNHSNSDSNFTNNADFSLSEGFSEMSLSSTESPRTVTPRPRPSGLCGPGQSLPAPPTKKAIKSTNSPVTPVARSPMISPTNTTFTTSTASPPSAAIQPPKRQQTNNKGMLPNVNRTVHQSSFDTGLSRSRARSTQKQRAPLKDSIQNASKSLEDAA